MNTVVSSIEISGQLNSEERRIITTAVLDAAQKPKVILEVGTWLGGGSTLHLLRALDQNGAGRLWGIEADRCTYDEMLKNIRIAAPEALPRFTPLFGFSQQVIPRWLKELRPEEKVDVVFLDGGNNPGEQIDEFKLLDPRIPIGGQLMAHDAKMRKGKWLVPYLSRLDNWKVQLHNVSENGLLHARKTALEPSPSSKRTAEMCLFKMRCHPVEIAAAILPSRVCGFVLRLLPRKLAWRISEGPR
jgi:predicted O-methyltransferase YrrM